MTAPITVPDLSAALPAKQRIRQAFDQAATGYDAAADVQREMSDQLAAHLLQTGLDLDPASILDAGCGTGYSARWLAQRWPRAELALLDFAPAMLAVARIQNPNMAVICADIEVLPLVETEGLTPLLMVLNQRADVTATVQQRSQQLSDQPG
jgi:malonyl-CoA O-methyltransferase